MKTNIITTVIAIVIAASMSSCVMTPRQGPQQMMQANAGFQHHSVHSDEMMQGRRMGPPREGPISPDQRRMDAARQFAKISSTEKLAPMDTTPEAFRALVDQNKRFRRGPDGVLEEGVLKVLVSGGVIGWSGHDFGFEPTIAETTGINDKISSRDVVNACVKYHRLPYASKPHWAAIREQVIAAERSRGVQFRG